MEKRAWWKEAVVYQIYPRSFADSNGDGIGDLQGIIRHLDYVKELGADVIWLSPIYKSPNDDNGYDISDYRDIMDDFGTMEDFDELLRQVHERGMRLVMDLVVNHTSDEHAWFVESRKSRSSPYRDYYIWRDGRDGKEPNNWGSCFSGSAWEKDEESGQYYLHLFSRKQPDLNWANPAVRDEVFDMMDWWCRKGIDGFRMDVIGMIGKENFQDGPMYSDTDMFGQFGPSCVHTETTHRYIQEMRQRVLSRYDLMTVGETGGTPEIACRYAGNDGKELNMVFAFEHVDLGARGELGKWNDDRVPLKDLREVMNRWQLRLQGRAWNSLFLENHDQPRSVSRFGDDGPLFREKSAKLLATMYMMMRGTPYIYQGQELGMTNICFASIESYQDVEVKNAWKQWVESGLVPAEDMLRYLAIKSRDNARTPMQWDSSAQAGFTSGKPWMEVNRNYLMINAEDERKNPDSVFHYYRRLIALRKEYSVLVYGEFVPLLENDADVYAYERAEGSTRVRVCCNFSGHTVPLALPMPGEELISNYHTHLENALRPWEARVNLIS